jgi:hypothetical protein
MKYTLSAIKQSLLSKTGARSLSNIANLYSMVQEVCFSMMEQVDLPSAIRRVPLFAPLAEEPNLYIVPNDFSHNGLIDVYTRDYTNKLSPIRNGVVGTEFRRRLCNSSLIELDNIDGVQFLNLGDQWYKKMNVIDNCDDSTNGDWTAVWDVTNVRYDTAHKISWTASLAFNIPITATQFGVQKLNFADIATTLNMNYITLYAYFPIYTTSVKIRYGADVGNYREVTLTRDWQGKRFTTGWNTLLFELSTATTTGVPTDEVTYFAFLIDDVITTAQLNYRIGGIYTTESVDYDLKYYSSSILCNQHGERIDTNLPTSDSDYLLLNNREYALFVKQFATISAIDTMVSGSGNQFNAYNQPLLDAYERFRNEMPSERVLVTTSY